MIIYFDTNIYNKIIDDSNNNSIIRNISNAVGSGIFEIIFSPLNFEEMLHTKNINKRTQLFKLVHSICSNKLFIDHKEILSKEYEAFLKKTSIDRKDLYYLEDEFKGTVQKIIEGTPLEGIPSNLFEEMKNRKRDYLAFEKKSKNELMLLWKEHNGLSYEEFYNHSLENVQGKAMLKNICQRAKGDKVNEDDISEINLDNMPGLRFLFKYICASIYNQLLKDEKPKWGSGIDMNHSVFIGNSDVFVTDDEDFLDIVRLFKESHTDCLSLNEFMNKYVQEN